MMRDEDLSNKRMRYQVLASSYTWSGFGYGRLLLTSIQLAQLESRLRITLDSSVGIAGYTVGFQDRLRLVFPTSFAYY